jgi:hypothetical protein
VLIYNASGAITASGNASINLTAASTGLYAGIAIFQARNNAQAVTVTGQASLNLNNALLYAAAAPVSVSGNGKLKAGLLVDQLHLSGNGSVLDLGDS